MKTERMAQQLDWMIGGVLAVITAVIFHPFASLGVDAHHDGIMLKPAGDVLSGQMLFRDTFSQYGPLTTYLQAGALALEPSLLSLRLLTVAAYAGSVVFLYAAWRSLLPRFLCVTAVAWYIIYAPFYDPYWHMLPWSSALALFFQCIALWALVRIVQEYRSPVWGWLLGAACACVFWCRQPVGILLGGSLAVIALLLYHRGWRPAGVSVGKVSMRVLMGFALVSVPLMAYLAFNGALGDWWYQNIIWPWKWAGTVDQTVFAVFSEKHLRFEQAGMLAGALVAVSAPALIRRLWCGLPLWVDWVWIGVFAIIFMTVGYSRISTCLLLPNGAGGGAWTLVILLGVVLSVIWRLLEKMRSVASSGLHHVQIALGGVALGAFAQLYPVPCMNHTYWAVAPSLGLIIYILWRCSNMRPLVCGAVLVLMLIPAAYNKYTLSHYAFGINSMELQAPPVLKGMRVEPAQADAYSRLARLLDHVFQQNPDRSGLLYGNDALYLAFFNNRENPSRYYVEWPKLVDRSERKKRLGFLVGANPVLFFNEREPEMVKRFMAVIADVGYTVVLQEPELSLWVALPSQEAVIYERGTP